MYSFSQNFEDVYIYRAFRDVADGFYIDVGAFDPVVDSVTKLFYDLGWSGINIEPGPLFPRFKSRTRDISLPYAVTAHEGEILFHYNHSDPGTSTTVVPSDIDDESSIDSYAVTSITLEHVVRDYAADRHIHFLKLDIEGAEWDVLQSTDWNKVRPELLIVESSLPYTNIRRDAGWADHMKSFGYHEVFFDGINTYYLREESLARGAAFDVPVNVLDGIRKFDPHQHQIRESEHSVLINNISKELSRVLEDEGSTVRRFLERELGPSFRAQSEQLAQLTSEQSEVFSRLQSMAKELASLSSGSAPPSPEHRSNSIDGLIEEISKGISNLAAERDQQSDSLALANEQAGQAREALREQEAMTAGAMRQVKLLTKRLSVARASRMTIVSSTEHVFSALQAVPTVAPQPSNFAGSQPAMPTAANGDASALASRIALARKLPAWRKLIRLGIRRLVRRADSLRDSGRFEQAAVAYAQSYALRPDRADICLQMANMLTNAGEFGLAESAYREALAKVPNDPLILLHLGHMLEISSRPAEARRAYADSARMLPDHPDLLAGLQRTGGHAGARSDPERAEA